MHAPIRTLSATVQGVTREDGRRKDAARVLQPGPLADYLRAAVRGGAGDDGLMQWFQLTVYPDDPGGWRNIDRWPDTKAKNRVFALFEKLSQLDPLALGTHIAEGDEIPFLRFALDAQERANGWRTDLERKIRSRDEHPVLERYQGLKVGLVTWALLPYTANWRYGLAGVTPGTRACVCFGRRPLVHGARRLLGWRTNCRESFSIEYSYKRD